MSCASQSTKVEEPAQKAAPTSVPVPPPPTAAAEEPRESARDYQAPRSEPAPDPALAPLLSACGEGEAALHRVAGELAWERNDVGALPDAEWTRNELTRWGAPYVEPRVWSAVLSADADPSEVAGRIGAWARQLESHGVLRCGIGDVSREDGARVLALVQVDARANLAPLPVAQAVGQTLVLDAEVDAETTDVELVVLPPEGRPRPVRVKLDGRRVAAKVRLDQAGPWVIQLLANDEGGPLPVLSATLWAGGVPPAGASAVGRPVPGESAPTEGQAPEDALLSMSNAARALSGLPALERSQKLDALAREHSQLMLERSAILHDAGDGPPPRRVEAAGISARSVGENVARAPSAARVHRILWQSPSHRGNLLFPHFDEIGIGVATASDGQLYTTLLLIDSR